MLSTPPAFVLSQDQTLVFNPSIPFLTDYGLSSTRFAPLTPVRQHRNEPCSAFSHSEIQNSFSESTVFFLAFVLCIVFKVRCSSAMPGRPSLVESLYILLQPPIGSQAVFRLGLLIYKGLTIGQVRKMRSEELRWRSLAIALNYSVTRMERE